jgi:hypothetical protein
MEQAIISGIANDKSEAKITIVGVPIAQVLLRASSKQLLMLTSTST